MMKEKRNKTLAMLAGIGLLVTGCAAVAPNLPSITEGSAEARDSGRIVWHDLLTHTPDESRRFYTELFGWEFERPGIGGPRGYELIRHNGRLIGGMVDSNLLREGENVSQWITVISVDDVAAATASVEREGGQVLTPPTDVGERGTLAVATGSEGAVFAMVQTRDGDPRDYEPVMNGWLWNELWTNDVEGSTTFYGNVLGYNVDDRQPEDADVTYRLFTSGDTPRAGVLANPFEDEQPVWVNYIRVDDPATITAGVEALGGRVIVEARDRSIGGKVALVVGPSGAGVALQTWPIDQGVAR